jgi:hypothetical protein
MTQLANATLWPSRAFVAAVQIDTVTLQGKGDNKKYRTKYEALHNYENQVESLSR